MSNGFTFGGPLILRQDWSERRPKETYTPRDKMALARVVTSPRFLHVASEGLCRQVRTTPIAELPCNLVQSCAILRGCAGASSGSSPSVVEEAGAMRRLMYAPLMRGT